MGKSFLREAWVRLIAASKQVFGSFKGCVERGEEREMTARREGDDDYIWSTIGERMLLERGQWLCFGLR